MWGVSWCCSVNVTIIRREHLPYPKMTTPIVHNICFNGEKKEKLRKNFFSGELPAMSRVDALSITAEAAPLLSLQQQQKKLLFSVVGDRA